MVLKKNTLYRLVVSSNNSFTNFKPEQVSVKSFVVFYLTNRFNYQYIDLISDFKFSRKAFC